MGSGRSSAISKDQWQTLGSTLDSPTYLPIALTSNWQLLCGAGIPWLAAKFKEYTSMRERVLNHSQQLRSTFEAGTYAPTGPPPPSLILLYPR